MGTVKELGAYFIIGAVVVALASKGNTAAIIKAIGGVVTSSTQALTGQTVSTTG